VSRPLIGVTVSELQAKEHAREPSHSKMVLGLAYTRAVERAGGIPVAIATLAGENIDPLLERLSGLLVSGGPDIDPSFYGAAPHPLLGPTSRDVDAFELTLCRRADELRIPILGICRGAQMLNVARHGTLHQHLPDINGGSLEHRQQQPGATATQEVRISPDSTLAEIVGAEQLAVNSFHHQGIDRLGERLRPVAWSQDGLIEAVEDTEAPLVLGVQWHAETLIDRAEQLALFERLVEAADAIPAIASR
jgi:putative glutamine amidotransferase